VKKEAVRNTQAAEILFETILFSAFFHNTDEGHRSASALKSINKLHALAI
jgi:hypothetical protein